MRYYTKIACWENKRRLRKLQEFREKIVLYFNNSSYVSLAEGRTENDAARAVRAPLNRMMIEVRSIILAADLSIYISYTPPAIIGGYTRDVDIIANIFNLHQFQMSPQYVVDYIDCAIGVYESNKLSSFFKTINPLFWFALALEYLVGLPFSVLGKAGFNSKKIEDSFLGKFVKTILYLIMVLASLLTILQFTGYLDEFNAFIRAIGKQ